MSLPKIYIIDDDPDISLQLEQSFLQQHHHDFDLEYFSNGKDALEKLLQPDLAKPSLIITDLNMPLKTGVEVLCELRDHPEYKWVPIVILTESSSETDLELLHGMGANYVFHKPDSFKGYLKLCRTLKKYWLETDLKELKNIYRGNIHLKPRQNHSQDHFLIIDDSILQRIMLEKILLEVKPKSVSFAYDGPRAVSTFKNLAKDGAERVIIFTKYHLPKMSGMKMAEMIRQYERKVLKRTISYIIVDSHPDQIDDEQLELKLFNDAIKRPYSIHDIETIIEKASKKLIHY